MTLDSTGKIIAEVTKKTMQIFDLEKFCIVCIQGEVLKD
jgi:hypothetical protein